MEEKVVLQEFERLQQNHMTEPYPQIAKRVSTLKRIERLLQQNAESIAEAIKTDFDHRSENETLLLEIFPLINSLRYCRKKLRKWTKPEKRHVSWLFKPARAKLFPQPLGVVGIVVPWNYPLYLALEPAAYALAAGNKVMIKLSELSPALGQLLKQLISESNLDHDLSIINGDVDISKAFVSLPFGHLLFTGSTKVGKQVMKAASEHLTPVTLELGGKSPVIISTTTNKNILSRLFFAKTLNAGQTCIAPDYLLIPAGWEALIEEQYKIFINKHYPSIMNNADYSAIISESHQQRLIALLEDAKAQGARVVEVGSTSEKPQQNQKMPVYLVFDIKPSMRLAQEEVFGPILPVISYQHFSEVLHYLNERPKPLACYYFGSDKAQINHLKFETLSGSLVINDCLMQVSIDDLPFGGVGNSGMGHYHGQEGFNTFSKLKPLFIQGRFSTTGFLYPPYGKLLRILLRLVSGVRFK